MAKEGIIITYKGKKYVYGEITNGVSFPVPIAMVEEGTYKDDPKYKDLCDGINKLDPKMIDSLNQNIINRFSYKVTKWEDVLE